MRGKLNRNSVVQATIVAGIFGIVVAIISVFSEIGNKKFSPPHVPLTASIIGVTE